MYVRGGFGFWGFFFLQITDSILKIYLTIVDLQYCVSFRCTALDSFPF